MHDEYMKRCLYLAEMGAGTVAPNPMVGCVIVHKGKIIGEGYHQIFGGPHAEVNAINSVKDKSLLSESSLYVNLEPCSHHGKTPPCADLIAKHQIAEVFIGCQDINAKVSGKGIEKLKHAGIKVKVGLLEKDSRELNRRFFTYHLEKRPYVILKWAQTLDGFIDIDRKKETSQVPIWITNETSRALVHKWRTEESAIMVGTNTAEKDNPKLNVRDWTGNNPLRVLLDRKNRLSENLHLFDQSIPTIVFTENKQESKNNLTFVRIDFKQDPILQILKYLYDVNILSIIVEGGRELLESFMKLNLWDEARIFIGKKMFFKGTKAPVLKGQLMEDIQIKESRLLILKPSVN